MSYLDLKEFPYYYFTDIKRITTECEMREGFFYCFSLSY